MGISRKVIFDSHEGKKRLKGVSVRILRYKATDLFSAAFLKGK